MRKLSFALLLIACFASASGQNGVIDSLNAVLKTTIPDSSRVSTLVALSGQYYRTDAEQARRLATEAKDLAEKIGDKGGVARAHKAIGMSYYFQSNWIDCLVQWKLALEAFRSINDLNGVSNMLSNLGAVHFNGGDDKSALDYYLESLRVAESTKDSLRTVTALVNIGTVYLTKEQSKPLAITYYRRALPLSKALGDYDAYGTCAVNLGEIFLWKPLTADSLKYYSPDSALFYFESALEAYRQSATGNIPVALKNIGRVYALRKDFTKAIRYQTEAFQIASATEARLEMAQSLLSLADTYKQKGDFPEAITNFNKAKTIAGEIEASYELQEAYLGLAKSYSKTTDFKQAYNYLNLYTDIKDTLYNADMDKKLQAQSLSYEIEKKEGQISLLEKDQELKALELKRQKAIRNGFMLGFALVVAFAGVFFFQRNRIAREKERSEELLLNILPKEVAEELKAKGEAEAKLISQVTVLFTDFKGFTAMSELVSPVGSSRVDLQACKLEYSIVSPK